MVTTTMCGVFFLDTTATCLSEIHAVSSDISDSDEKLADDGGYYNTAQVTTDLNVVDLQKVISEKSKGKQSTFFIEYKVHM